MALSSNTIIHFTKTADALKGILQHNFKLKYCVENVNFEGPLDYAAPMVSFCDIPLSQIKEHIGKYGAYGLGLTKEWAERQRLNPVLYVQSNSFLAKSIQTTYLKFVQSSNIVDWKLLNEEEQDMLNVLRYVKNYEADLSRGGIVEKNYRFSDEREWRYTPDYESCNVMAVTPTAYRTIEEKKVLNSALSSLRLSFEPDDIKYIIIERDSEISEFLNVLRDTKGNKYSLNDLERLMTRIITTEQIKTDL